MTLPKTMQAVLLTGHSGLDKLEVNPTEETIRVGEMKAFTARVVSPTGETIEAPVTWTIAPARVARVDMMGTVTGLDPGAATLTATAGVGGICVWAYLRSFPGAKLIPIRDPRIIESLTHHE